MKGDIVTKKEKGLFFSMKKNIEKNYENKKTRKAYKAHSKKFCEYTKGKGYTAEYVRNNALAVIQEYADYLVTLGKSAPTVHTYIAYICQFFKIDMKHIKKPKRKTADIKKSRNNKLNAQGIAEETSCKYSELVKFQSVVGIRRTELKRLRKNNLTRDDAGYLCVEVMRGKGGKHQLQRILPENEEFVASFFDGSNEKIFSDKTMSNKIDLHSYRSANARKAYEYYLEICKTEAGRNQLLKELEERYKKHNIKYINEVDKQDEHLAEFLKESIGLYILRGDVKNMAIAKGKPTEYDRTALMAVSVFHLSHWRCNVTVYNYMLA